MTLPYNGNARYPGLLGTGRGTSGGHPPGLLGFKQENAAKGSATRGARTLEMPPPWSSSTSIRVATSSLKLADGSPKLDDVMQGALANCPLAAILGALAFTPVGQKHLDPMVTEYNGITVRTALPPGILKKLEPETDSDEHPQNTDLVTTRYFSVQLPGAKTPFQVHDTFYVKYDDRDLTDLVFMQARNSVLWPAVIEKACALHFGGYNEMGNFRKHKANEFWALLLGKAPQGIEIKESTDLAKISALAAQAKSVPMLAASRGEHVLTNLTPEHGFTVLGADASNVMLYDPAKAKRITLPLEDFRKAFDAILHGAP